MRIVSVVGARPQFVKLAAICRLLLESRARFILTDSGGVQKEAYFFKIPCITLRGETEWQETLENHCNVLTDCRKESILQAALDSSRAGPWTAVYGDGKAGARILDALANH